MSLSTYQLEPEWRWALQIHFTLWLQWLVSEDREFSQVVHSGCYDSWILIFFPDFTAVSLDKVLKDRANRVLVSNMALLVRKLGALVLLRWWWFAPDFFPLDIPTSGNRMLNRSDWYNFFRPTWCLSFEKRTIQCFYQNLGKRCKGMRCPFLLSHEKIGLLKHLTVCLLFSMFVFCLIWPSCCSAHALLPHLALPGKIFWKSELSKPSTCCPTILVCWLKSLLLLIAHHPENNFKNLKIMLH